MKPLVRILGEIGEVLLLTGRTLSYAGSLPRQWRRILEQCYIMGYATFPIVAILSFFIGSVLALQTGYSMREFGAQEFIGGLVGISLARELAPVMTAILLVGRVGSAVTAELASMQVYQEIDALKTMNIPPERMLVLPRLVAVLLMMPLLTIVANVVGWMGGATVARYIAGIGVDPETYYNNLRNFVDFKDVLDGLIKAEVFGFWIIVVCCHVGFSTRGGPREVGFSVTRAVVISLILILVLDYFVTRILF